MTFMDKGYAGCLVSALALFVVLLAFVGLYALVSKDITDQLAAVLRMSRTVVSGSFCADVGLAPIRTKADQDKGCADLGILCA